MATMATAGLNEDNFCQNVLNNLNEVLEEHFEKNEGKLKRDLRRIVYDQSIFNSVNQSLNENFKRQLEWPEETLKKFCKVIIMQKLYEHPGVARPNPFVSSQPGDANAEADRVIIERMTKGLRSVAQSEQDNHGQEILQDKQKTNVYLAVDTYLNEVRKNLANNVMASINRLVLNKYEKFVESLALDKKINDFARESSFTLKKRS